MLNRQNTRRRFRASIAFEVSEWIQMILWVRFFYWIAYWFCVQVLPGSWLKIHCWFDSNFKEGYISLVFIKKTIVSPISDYLKTITFKNTRYLLSNANPFKAPRYVTSGNLYVSKKTWSEILSPSELLLS